MNTAIFTDKASMTSVEIAELVGKRHDNVKRTIETLAKGGVVRSPQIEVSERINNLGVKVQHEHYLFEGEQGKRDSIIVVAQLCPEFTACLVDRWRELEKQIRKPMSQIEMVAAMALEAVRQQRRLEQVEEKVT
ncbi:TPA: Rha family transcriptional regulator, partial [Escherichia coli]